jgi:hypothetical protein
VKNHRHSHRLCAGLHSTDEQDLTVQRDALTALGVAPERIYVDHWLTGTNHARRELREAMAAGKGGDALVVTKSDPVRGSRT